jgi:hypothetical protein
MCGTCVSFPFCRARLKMRFSVVSSRLISPFETFRSRLVFALADDDHVGPSLQDERVDVSGCDRCEPAPTEAGEQVQTNTSLEFIC